jgi:predicted GNAT family N-acyltransferase
MQSHRESSLSITIRKTIEAPELSNSLSEKKLPFAFSIKIANTLEEREAVFHLGYQVYLEKKYIKENQNQWLIQNYDFLPQTTILIVQDKNKNIAGSLTLVFDGDGKLPIEKIYSEEFNLLKSNNIKAIEISRLVIANEYRNEKEVLQLMINYLMIYAYHVKDYSSLVIQVNPRHKIYYKTLLGFEEIGSEKECPIVQNAPAVLLHLPLIHYQSEILRFAKNPEPVKKERSLYPYFLKPEQEKLVAHYLQKQFKPMNSEEKIYFGFTESGISKAVCV